MTYEDSNDRTLLRTFVSRLGNLADDNGRPNLRQAIWDIEDELCKVPQVMAAIRPLLLEALKADDRDQQKTGEGGQ